MMDYAQAWHFLDQLQFFKIKLGLEAMRRFLKRLGSPEQKLRCIHIGGTNGKGSVAATLLPLCQEAGFRTGVYTSPHLSSVRERFRINSAVISRDDFARLASRIRGVLGNEQITYFEFTTTLALLWFAEQQVDLALLEVGMGGRLDATNVITPKVTVITNVSLDHEQYLGQTLAAIASEKAGIIKAGVPLVTAVAAAEGGQVVTGWARKLGAPLYRYGADFSSRRQHGNAAWDYQGLHGSMSGLPLVLKGRHQLVNMALALATTEVLTTQGMAVSPAHIRAGLGRVTWPGRLEEIQGHQHLIGCGQRRFLLDGAHNPAGATTLRQALQEEYTFAGLVLVWGGMADKDISNTLGAVADLARTIVLTQAETQRSAPPETLLQLLPPGQRERAICVAAVDQALQLACERTTSDDLICVAGSLYLVGRARELLAGSLTEER